MTSLFDGVAGLMSDVFGSPVTLTPQTGSPRTIRAVVRSAPVELVAPDGHAMMDVQPEMRVTADVASTIRGGDSITTATGRKYRIVASQPSGSPAADAMVIYALEAIE